MYGSAGAPRSNPFRDPALFFFAAPAYYEVARRSVWPSLENLRLRSYGEPTSSFPSNPFRKAPLIVPFISSNHANCNLQLSHVDLVQSRLLDFP